MKRQMVAAVVAAVTFGIVPIALATGVHLNGPSGASVEAGDDVGAEVAASVDAAVDVPTPSVQPDVAVSRPSQAEPKPRPSRPQRPPKDPQRPPQDPERPAKEQLRLACQPTDRPAIACKWSESRHPAFAGYELWRGDGSTRHVVFRTRDRGETGYVDTEVRQGQAYMYAVQVLDAHGNVIGFGGPVKAGVRPTDPEPMRLACSARDATAIACKWSPSTRESFAAYELIRGDGSGRAVVFRTRERDHTFYVDGDVVAGKTYMYVVHALDGHGNVIGSGGPVKAQVPAPTSFTRPTAQSSSAPASVRLRVRPSGDAWVAG